MSHSNVKQLIHVMWSTYDQKYSIPSPINNYLCGYIKLAIRSQIPIGFGGMITISVSRDHVHLLLFLPQDICLSSLMRHIKSSSSKWLKNQSQIDPNFQWQDGFIAFSTQEDMMDKVKAYIDNDITRHINMNYSSEALNILTKQNINFNEKFFLQNTLSKIIVHTVWSTQYRMPLLSNNIQQNLYNFIKETVLESKGDIYEIGGVEDHIHILMEVPRDKPLSDLIKDIKTKSTHWLKLKDPLKFNDFGWQNGFGGFTISYSSINSVSHYIQQQEEHHRKRTFQEELQDLFPQWKIHFDS